MSIMSIFDKMTETEKKVGEFLTEVGIWWKFENPLFVRDEAERPRIWAPDFHLTHLGIHVEVCGSEEFDYKYREKIYYDNDLRVIFVHYYKNPGKWKHFLLQRIKEIQEKRKTIIEKAMQTTQRTRIA